MPHEERIQVDKLLRLIEETQKSINEVDAKLAIIANDSQEIKLLLTLQASVLFGHARYGVPSATYRGSKVPGISAPTSVSLRG